MELLEFVWNLLVHLDTQLEMLLAQYGGWLYAILFLIIFCETGLVVTPFLPGDSLLFMAGALAAGGGLDPVALIGLLFVAAVLGDSTNYAIGRRLGSRVERWPDSRLFNRKAYDYTAVFYARHGGKTVVLARFVPLVRTFAPFVAGVASMPYGRFAAFNVLGAALWVGPLIALGYFFGNLPIVRSNLSAVILAIIALSLLPVVLARARQRTVRAAS